MACGSLLQASKGTQAPGQNKSKGPGPLAESIIVPPDIQRWQVQSPVGAHRRINQLNASIVEQQTHRRFSISPNSID